jgi:hypothetical protein
MRRLYVRIPLVELIQGEVAISRHNPVAIVTSLDLVEGITRGD